MSNIQAISDIVPAVKYQRKPKRYYFDVALGSILLSGEDTGEAYCLLDLKVAPGLGVPRHTHTREDEAYFVLSGELTVIVNGKETVLKANDSCVIEPNETREIINRGNEVCSIVVAVATPPK